MARRTEVQVLIRMVQHRTKAAPITTHTIRTALSTTYILSVKKFYSHQIINLIHLNYQYKSTQLMRLRKSLSGIKCKWRAMEHYGIWAAVFLNSMPFLSWYVLFVAFVIVFLITVSPKAEERISYDKFQAAIEENVRCPVFQWTYQVSHSRAQFIHDSSNISSWHRKLVSVHFFVDEIILIRFLANCRESEKRRVGWNWSWLLSSVGLDFQCKEYK